MRLARFAGPAALLLALAVPAFADDAKAAPQDASMEAAPLPEGLTSFTPEEVKKMVDAGTVHVYDVNGKETRAKYGVVPGAAILGSVDEWSLKRLPADKSATLVFYCANPRCTACHGAAKKAIDAGYTDVHVMSAGIKGWADAGFVTEKGKG